MKHLLKSVSILAMLFFVVVAVGQNREGLTANNNFINIHMLTKHLDLTQDQVDAIDELMQAQNQQIRDLRTTGGIAVNDREAFLAAVREIKAETEANILKIFTPEQLTTYNQLLVKQADRVKGHNNNIAQGNNGIRGGLGGQIGMLDRQLDLTDEQLETIKEILANQREKMVSIRTSVGENPDRDAIKARLQSIRTETENAIKTILTAEQLVIYNEILDKRNNRGGKTLNPGQLDGQKIKGNKIKSEKGSGTY